MTQQPASPFKILLLDDNPTHAELIREILTDRTEDFAVETFHRSEDFLNRLNSAPCDLSLIDFNLLNTTGLEVLNKMRQMNISTPAILLSGAQEEDVIVQSLDAGATDFVIKTRTSLATLPQIVRRHLQKSQTQRSPEPSIRK